MKRKKYAVKKKPKLKEISSSEPSQLKTTCYICNKTKSKDQMLTVDAGKGLYRCRGGKCEQQVLQNALKRCGALSRDIPSIVIVEETKRRGRPPKVQKAQD